jgi:hypothetical protein
MGSTRLIITVSLAIFCVDVDFFALNLALPATARGLGVSTTDLQWAITVFQLTLASLLIPAGRLVVVDGTDWAVRIEHVLDKTKDSTDSGMEVAGWPESW